MTTTASNPVLPRLDEVTALLNQHYLLSAKRSGHGVHIHRAKAGTLTVAVTAEVPGGPAQPMNLSDPERYGYHEIDVTDEVQHLLMSRGYYAHRSTLNSVHVLSREDQA